MIRVQYFKGGDVRSPEKPSQSPTPIFASYVWMVYGFGFIFSNMLMGAVDGMNAVVGALPKRCHLKLVGAFSLSVFKLHDGKQI
jgi:hypothetical protein